MRKWKCVKTSYPENWKVGKIYTEVGDGVLITENGAQSSVSNCAKTTKFEEVTQFTKADLKPCMVVVRRNGSVCGIFQTKNGLKFQDNLSGGNCEGKHYNDDLTSTIDEKFDIMKVFDLPDDYFSISVENRPLLFERIEKSPTQLKLEELENKQRELADMQRKVADDISELRKEVE